MKNLFMYLVLTLSGLQTMANSREYISDSRTLILVDSVRTACEQELILATTKRLKILKITEQMNETDGKLTIVTVMQTGFYGHPLTDPDPRVIRILTMTQIQKEGPVPADASPFFNTTCEIK